MTAISKRQVLGLIGSAFLVVGAFCPVIKVPFLGDMNYFQIPQGLGNDTFFSVAHAVGMLLIALALASAALVVLQKYKGLWVTGLASVGTLGVTYVLLQVAIDHAKARVDSEISAIPLPVFGDALQRVANTVLGQITIQWGWGVMLVGAMLVLATALLPETMPARAEVAPVTVTTTQRL